MSPNFTREQVLALAPDAQVAHAGQKLAQPGQWQDAGREGPVVWGYYQGSGSDPYQVALDLEGPAFKCSCPSRKRPCKHALGLFLLVASQPGAAPPAERPDWLGRWPAGSADGKAAGRAGVGETPAAGATGDAGRAGKRAAVRAQHEKRVQEGVAALAHWLEDVVREGAGDAQSRPASSWEDQAARLVDAQAPGLARRVREMAGIPHSGDGWPGRLLDRLARLYLLLEAFRNLERLSGDLQEEVRSQIGWVQEQEALRSEPGIRDNWLVVGQQVTEEDRLRVQRTWLWGERTQTAALILDFAPPGRPLECTLVPGTGLDAELVFWPGPLRQRALIKTRHRVGQMQALPGFAALSGALAAYSAALAANPWLDRFLVPLAGVTIAPRNGGWDICDTAGHSLPLVIQDTDGWRLLALGGGHPLGLAAEWDGERLAPLSAWSGGRLHPIGAAPSNDGYIAAGAAAAGGPWPRLVAGALVGTGRTAPPAINGATPALEALLRSLDGEPPERRLLAQAAAVSTWRKAGTQPADRRLPLLTAAPADTQALCSSTGAAYLARMLQEPDLMAVLPEWLAALHATGQTLPHRWLPELLDLACARDELRPDVVAGLGARGEWLAAQNPAWAGLLIPSGAAAIRERWRLGTLKERAYLLAGVRRTDSTLGRELVVSTWEQEPPREREMFLRGLLVGLSMADEPFLEAALDDRRKDVRTAAVDLAARLPASRLCRRMTERVRPLLHYYPGEKRGQRNFGQGKKPALAVTLPESCDRGMIRDGVDARPGDQAGMGEHAWWLVQMLGAVPPDVWTQAWSATPAELVAAAGDGEWREPLWIGWHVAAQRHRSAAWAEALVRAGLETVVRVKSAGGVDARLAEQQGRVMIEQLWPVLPEARRETLVIGALAAQRQPAGEEHVAAWLLGLCMHGWSVRLGRAVLRAAQGRVRKATAAAGPDWRWRGLLKTSALYMPPTLVAEAARGWPQETPAWGYWASTVEEFVALLRFRYEMGGRQT